MGIVLKFVSLVRVFVNPSIEQKLVSTFPLKFILLTISQKSGEINLQVHPLMTTEWGVHKSVQSFWCRHSLHRVC